jgi:alkylation response protein AidB-like acyl-CoA dehydrogenase
MSAAARERPILDFTDLAKEGDALARARTVAPLIEAAAPRIEAAREITPDVLDALHGAGLFRLLLPRDLDGEEMSPAAYVRVVETIARADASTAWCLNQGSGCSMAAAYVDAPVARAVWGDPRAVLAWGQPPGRATRVDGGYRATARWLFASGSRHSDWLGGHCIVVDENGAPIPSAGGKPTMRTLLFPKSSARVTDTWNVVGLRGTGSDTYSVENLFVPEEYSLDRDSYAECRQAGPLYRFSTTHIYAAGFGSVALGIAQGALDAFVALAREKTPQGTTAALRDSGVVQTQIAVAESKLRAARAFLRETLEECWAAVQDGHLSLDQRVSIRMASTYATHQAREVVDTAYHEAGATAIFQGSAFERRFRDVHTVCQQVQGRYSHFETVGQHMLGLTPNMRHI